MAGVEEGAVERELRRLLPGWGLGEDAPVERLSMSENLVCLAGGRAGGGIVLRAHRPGYHRPDEILSEIGWIRALRQAGVVRTPRPLERRDGGWLGVLEAEGASRAVSAFEFVPGAEPDSLGDLVPQFRELGRVSARLHRHARDWPRPPGFVRRRWDAAATLGRHARWGDWRAARGLRGDGRALLTRAAERLEARLLAYGTGPERFGLVHADLRLANLLLDGDGLTVIDFDDCGFGWFLADFAAAVSFLEEDPQVPALRAAWLEGYRSLAPVAPAEEAMLPVFAMLRRLGLTAWIASRRGSPVADGFGEAFTDGTLRLAERFLTESA